MKSSSFIFKIKSLSNLFENKSAYILLVSLKLFCSKSDNGGT
jgi:hypothetical protein